MTHKKKSLPKPPHRPFGPKKRFAEASDARPRMEEEMADAAVRGKLDDYLAQNFGDNENARRLAEMMMGMTGMPAMGIPGSPPPTEKNTAKPPRKTVKKTSEKAGPNMGNDVVPEGIAQAVASGDVASLMGLLKQEHEKRSGRPVAEKEKKKKKSPPPTDASGSDAVQPASTGFVEKEVLDVLLRIAAENNVSVDWVIARALRLYTRDFKTTGRM